MKQLFTSLKEIQSFLPCRSGWARILIAQNKTEVDDIMFPLEHCVNTGVISDICWLLGKRRTEISIAVNFARKCADSVKHLYDTGDTGDTVAAANYATKYAVAAAKDAADAAAYAANYAATAYAADAANYAATTAAANYIIAATADAARKVQQEKNKQFMINAIKEYEMTK